ncbi:unnamed protein product [Psylliodes chrysocephalus]|uniref:THAP-type domain-containing protein n=1 Tax=Psylliodes chrysocephalus TaxID=3402493 RepID=A0A9P0CTG9_9CUCU|nr:unnamed protein product [Psylliodes chrysocephala]
MLINYFIIWLKVALCVKNLFKRRLQDHITSKFPFLDTEKRSKWFQNLGVDQVASRWIFLCSDHFAEEDFYYTPQERRVLKKNAFPLKVNEKSVNNPITISSGSSSDTNTASEEDNSMCLSNSQRLKYIIILPPSEPSGTLTSPSGSLGIERLIQNEPSGYRGNLLTNVMESPIIANKSSKIVTSPAFSFDTKTASEEERSMHLTKRQRLNGLVILPSSEPSRTLSLPSGSLGIERLIQNEPLGYSGDFLTNDMESPKIANNSSKIATSSTFSSVTKTASEEERSMYLSKRQRLNDLVFLPPSEPSETPSSPSGSPRIDRLKQNETSSGDFSTDDMESPKVANRSLKIAKKTIKRQEQIIADLLAQNRRLKTKVNNLQDLLCHLRKSNGT